MPVGGGHHRASSMSGPRPAQVIINNDNGVQLEDSRSDGRRPSSSHGGRYCYEDRYYDDRERPRIRARTPSPFLDFETQQKLKEFEDMKRREEDEKRTKELEEKIIFQQTMEEAERAERLKEERELKRKAIEEYKVQEAEDKIKKQKEQEKEDKEFKDRMRKTLWANGYSDEQIERMIMKAEKNEPGHGSSRKSRNEIAMPRPTYVKVHRRHIDPETLDLYELPWEWNDVRFPILHYTA